MRNFKTNSPNMLKCMREQPKALSQRGAPMGVSGGSSTVIELIEASDTLALPNDDGLRSVRRSVRRVHGGYVLAPQDSELVSGWTLDELFDAYVSNNLPLWRDASCQ